MKVIIAGGRDFDDYKRLESIMLDYPLVSLEIVSGGARGADSLAENFALYEEITFKLFPADWEKYGKAAGHIRNAEMAKYADTLVAFWDGKSRGTKGMIGLALKEGLEVHVYRYKGGTYEAEEHASP